MICKYIHNRGVKNRYFNRLRRHCLSCAVLCVRGCFHTHRWSINSPPVHIYRCILNSVTYSINIYRENR